MQGVAEKRATMEPPAPGSLKVGDICPCGCGGRMELVNGILTAVTAQLAMPDGSRISL